MSMEAGWYPDPFSNGYLRWWDGERWTPQTSVPQPVGPGAPTAPASPASPWGAPTQPPGPPAAPPYAPPYGAPYGAPTGAPPGAPWGGYAGPTASPQVAPYPLASYGSRIGARLIDTLILGVVLLPLVVAALWTPLHDFVNSLPTDGSAPSTQLVTDFETRIVGRVLAVSFLSLVVQLAYEVPQLVKYGRTVGKRVAGIRVRPLAEDRLPTLKEAMIRWGVSAGGSFVGGGLFTLLDDLFPLWDKPWQQTLHDKAAKTVVVPNRSPIG